MFNFFKKKKTLPKDNLTPLAAPPNSLAEQIMSTLPEGMKLPGPLEKLCDWIEANNYTISKDGSTRGWLFDPKSRDAVSAPIIDFNADGSKNLKHWFGQDSQEIHDRLYIFCKTGQEGSQGGFWLDDDGKQHIVHLGGGSGSIMTCVPTDNAVDFLRLLAIGYDEICWGHFKSLPECEIPLNSEFQHWVETEFSVSIPQKGEEIVPETSEITDAETSSDPFLRWVTKMVDEGDYA